MFVGTSIRASLHASAPDMICKEGESLGRGSVWSSSLRIARRSLLATLSSAPQDGWTTHRVDAAALTDLAALDR